ncbi:uncharacterized protein [Triticum aestivum]|uniref:uncharacterized protein isoform X3 n=1 Tax=Triticum aestivum TaxID=4565 RepID=UPI001D0268D3|nr:uncharacterized protein LOC123127284 isoform X3 [Triticum aestivum]
MRVADSDHMRGAAPTTCTTPPVSLCAVGVDHLSAGATPRSKLEVHYLSPSDLPCSSPRVLLFMCRQKPAMSSRGRSNKDARGVVSASRHPLVMSTRTLNVEAAREELELPEESGGGGVVSPPQPRQQGALRPWRETGTKVAFQGHGRVCWWACSPSRRDRPRSPSPPTPRAMARTSWLWRPRGHRAAAPTCSR